MDKLDNPEKLHHNLMKVTKRPQQKPKAMKVSITFHIMHSHPFSLNIYLDPTFLGAAKKELDKFMKD